MEEKITAWIARDENGRLNLFLDGEARKDTFVTNDGYWFTTGDCYIELPKTNFPQVKWEDEEPTEVELTIKICE